MMPESSQGPRPMLPPVVFAATFVRIGAALSAVGAGMAWVADGRELGLKVAIGSLLMLTNILLTARGAAGAIERVRAGAESGATVPVAVPGLGAQILFKMPFLALALFGVLWYMPARPEGLALGIGLGLIAAIWAGIATTRKLRSSKQPAHG